MSQTLTAQDVFRSAYDNRYTWDKNFPGYTATATMKSDDEKHQAKVTIKSDLSFETSEIEDETAKKSIQGQLWEMTIHRVKHSFEEIHGKNTFNFGEKDSDGAVEILVGGASSGNSYKVKDDTVSFVNRRIRDKVVNINTLKTLDTDEGYLSEEYESFYINPETGEKVTGVTKFTDTFEKIGGYYILTKRVINGTDAEGNAKTVEYTFSDVEMLK